MTEPERWPGEHAQLERIVQAKREREEMLAKMTPEERAAWIAEWAKKMAEHEVEEGIAYDRYVRGEKPK